MPSPNIATILRHHVSLSTSCIDRLYLNGYVPKLQSTGQLCAFLCDHLGNQIASPAAFRPLHDRSVQAITAFAEQHLVPVIQFERGHRKDDVAAQYRARHHAPEGVVFIGVAQERQFSFKATSTSCRHTPSTSRSRASRSRLGTTLYWISTKRRWWRA